MSVICCIKNPYALPCQAVCDGLNIGILATVTGTYTLEFYDGKTAMVLVQDFATGAPLIFDVKGLNENRNYLFSVHDPNDVEIIPSGFDGFSVRFLLIRSIAPQITTNTPQDFDFYDIERFLKTSGNFDNTAWDNFDALH